MFGIEKTEPRDEDADTDNDGVDDTVDSCPGVVNTGDEDRDGIDDACDNCPLAVNPRQVDSDEDAIGDHCDPNPLLKGDCLAVFDSFAEPTAFAQNWDVQPAGSPAVVALPGRLHLDSPYTNPVQRILVLAKGVADATAIDVLADSDVRGTEASFGVGLHMTDPLRGRFCELYWTGVGGVVHELYAAELPPQTTADARMSSRSVGTRLLARFSLFVGQDKGTMRCRMEHGVAVGAVVEPFTPSFSDGAPAIGFDSLTGDVLGAALYRFDAAGCAPEVRR